MNARWATNDIGLGEDTGLGDFLRRSRELRRPVAGATSDIARRLKTVERGIAVVPRWDDPVPVIGDLLALNILPQVHGEAFRVHHDGVRGRAGFALMWISDVKWAKSILTEAGVKFAQHARNPCEKLSDLWYAWEFLSGVQRVWSANQKDDASTAAREASLLGELRAEFRANWSPLVRRAERDRARHKRDGRKGGLSRDCKRCRRGPSRTCGCPPWRDVAHDLNASLLANSSINSVRRAQRIASKLGFAVSTVQNEISSPKNRAKYPHFYG